MSAAEFSRWCDYFNKFGRLTPVRMFDYGAALLATRVDSAMGKRSAVRDYLLFVGGEPEEASASDVMKELWGVKRG